MFFIFGMPRSGTTLLSQCLSAHPEIIVPHETDFIIPMAFIIDRIDNEAVGRDLIHRLIVHSKAFPDSIGEYLESQTVYDVIYSCAYHPWAILESLYEKIAESADAGIAGDKSPNDLNFIRMLVKTGGLPSEAKIVHIVRDIRDVMVSVNKTGWVSDLDLYFPRFWCNHNLYLNALYRDDESRYMLIRYEDFVSSPESTLNGLCRFLGVEFDEEMLLPGKRHERYKKMGEVHSNVSKPISTDRIGIYMNSLDRETLGNYETQAREALAVFGYVPQPE